MPDSSILTFPFLMPTKRKNPDDSPSCTTRSLKEKIVSSVGQFIPQKEVNILTTLAAVVCSGFRPTSGRPYYSYWSAAKDYECNHKTPRQHSGGRSSSCQDAALPQRLLTDPEKAVVKEYGDKHARHAMPSTGVDYKEAATIVSGVPCGDCWLHNFHKWTPSLVVKVACPLEAPRTQSLNNTNITAYFNMLCTLITQYNILPQNIYNMDEKGVMLGKGLRQHVLVDWNIKTVHSIEDGNRQNITIIKCVCADGSSIQPCVIFKGKRNNLTWGDVNPCKARYELVPLLMKIVLTEYPQYFLLSKRLDRSAAWLSLDVKGLRP
jgi:hypothetical protein